MIAVSSSGKSFRALAAYLERGRSGAEGGRIAWSEGRNLATGEPRLAAEIMRATAAIRDERVAQPVFHVAVSFDPHDRPTRTQMRQVATRLLADLGLSDHQALVIAHQDRAHRHLHIVVNRIHPETGVAWDRWQEQARTQRSLRAQETALGFRQVSGRLHHVEGREAPDRSAVTNAEWRQKARTTEPLFVDRARLGLPVLRAARSWDDLESALAVRGLRLARKGQGLVITDGEREVKASRVHRELSLRQLEKRYGVVLAERHHASSRHPRRAMPGTRDHGPAADFSSARRDRSLGLRARYVAVRLQQFERGIRLEHALSVAGALLDRGEARVRAHQAAVSEFGASRAAFARSLARVYREPEAARAAFDAAVAVEGVGRAVQQLCERPDAFGTLRSRERGQLQERPQRLLGGLGLRGAPDPTAARQAALMAVDLAADRAVQMRAAARVVPAADERGRAMARLETARARYDRLRDAAERLPLRHRLARNLAHGMEGLSAREWATVRRSLTARQVLIGDVLRDAIRVDRVRAERRMPRGERSTTRDQSRLRPQRSRRAGAAVHRTMLRIAPRELRQVVWAVGAVGHPGLAVRRLLTQTVREAMLGLREQER